MTPLRSKHSRKIAHLVAAELVDSITAQRLEPGTVLPSEATMIREFNVSRASVRESLRILEVLGLIQLRPGPGGGPVIAKLDSRSFAEVASLYFKVQGATYRDILDARVNLEPVAVRLAAERRDDDHVHEIRDYLDDATQLDLLDNARFRSAGQRFHALLASMSGNSVIDVMVRCCVEVHIGHKSHFLFPVDQRREVVDLHAQIAQAVIDREPEGAELLMRRHMRQYEQEALGRDDHELREVVEW